MIAHQQSAANQETGPNRNAGSNRKSISEPKTGSGMLAVGGAATILASTCCLGPLVLVLLGFTGAWIGNLSALEPYRPFFLALALIALIFAGRRIFRPEPACDPTAGCATATSRRVQQMVFIVVALLALVALVFPYFARFFY